MTTILATKNHNLTTPCNDAWAWALQTAVRECSGGCDE